PCASQGALSFYAKSRCTAPKLVGVHRGSCPCATSLCLLCAALVWTSVRAGDDQDRYEEQATSRFAQHKAERSLRGDRGERGNTVRDLEAAFPGKLTKTEAGKIEDEG